jgi:hypothetical protein
VAKYKPEGTITLKNNVVLEATGHFADPRNGDLHFKKRLPEITDKALPLDEVTKDIDGEPRGKNPDIGADELP